MFEEFCLFHSNCTDWLHTFGSVMIIILILLGVSLFAILVYLVWHFVSDTLYSNSLVGENYREIQKMKTQLSDLHNEKKKNFHAR